MTDVHFHPATELAAPGPRAQSGFPLDPAVVVDRTVILEEPDAGAEMAIVAAFERGRMQGEMEAIRRLEQEQNSTVLKQFPVDHTPVIVERPDVVELNRLTWPQRISAFVGEAAALAYIALTIIWVELYRGDFGWTNSNNGDASADVNMWNTHILCSVLGLFFLSQAILLYRVLPMRTPVFINRVMYTFNYCAAVTCFTLSLVANIKTEPGTTFWGVDSWCFALAYAVVGIHFVYSMAHTWLRPQSVDYEHWAEVNNRITLHQSAEQRRDQSIANGAGRSVYAPAPHFPSLAHGQHNVPAAPANAPRWAENPNHHQEDYFLVPRAKWAVCGFFAMGAAILMDIAHVEHTLASASSSAWAQESNQGTAPLNEAGNQAGILGALGVLLLGSVLMIAYAAMPPRTTLVKNGILTDSARRSSISHNAETRIGHNIV